MTTVETELLKPTPVRCYKFEDAVITDVGRRRNENQDAYSIAHTRDASLYIVADGMGGARGGATASAIAVNIIAAEAILRDGSLIPASLKTAIERSNKVIFARSRQDEELQGMGTTVVALAFVGDGGFVAHVGDSRIYQWSKGQLTQLTRDHTLVQELVDTGAIAPEEAANHPIAHMLTRSLGPTDGVEVELKMLPGPVQNGDKFLLCSDGLYNLVSFDEIGTVMSLKPPPDAVRELVDLALDRGGTDNVTVEILEVLLLEDAKLSVTYPENGKVELVVSRPAEISNLEQLLREVVAQEMAASDTLTDAAAGNGSSPDSSAFAVSGSPAENGEGRPPLADTLRLEAVEQRGMPQESRRVTFAEQPRSKHSKSGRHGTTRRGTSSGLLFLGSVLVGTVLFVGYQYDNLRRMMAEWQKKSETKIAAPAVVHETAQPDAASQRDELADELDQWAKKMEVARNTDPVGSQSKTGGKSPSAVQRTVPPQVETSGTEKPVNPEHPEDGLIHEPAISELPVKSDAFIEAIKAQANDLSLNPAPEIEIRDEEVATEKATRPIIWENEQRKLAALLRRPATAKTPETDTAEALVPTLFSESELFEMSREKTALRDRIADLDAKLALLGYATKEEADGERLVLEKALAATNAAIESTRKDIDRLQSILTDWNYFKKETAGRQKTQFAGKIAKYDEELNAKYSSFALMDQEYKDTVQRWQKNPTDLSIASKMGELGRQLEKERSVIEEAVGKAIKAGIERNSNVLANAKVTLDNLELRSSRINRHIGYVNGFSPLTVARRRELVNTYLKERRDLVGQHEQFRRRLVDGAEIALLRHAKAKAAATK